MKFVVHGILLTIPVDQLEIQSVHKWFDKKAFFPCIRSRLEILSRLLMDSFSLLILLYSHQGNYYDYYINIIFSFMYEYCSKLLLI